MRTRLLLLGLALPFLSGCLALSGRHWDEARRTVIEPINSAVHRHLARDIRSKDLAAILDLYSTDTGTGLSWNEPHAVPSDFTEQRLRWAGPPSTESIADRYAHMLGLFETIERAEVRLHNVHWNQRDDRGYPAEVRLIVRGIAGTERLMLDQWNRMHLAQQPGGEWRIAAEEVTARDVVRSAAPAFEVATERAGIDDTHDTTGSPPFRLLGDVPASSGAAVGDVDCDGLEDIALLSTSRLALYRNRGDGTFSEVAAAFGFPEAFDQAATGLVFFDADNDGDPDLWVSGIRGERFYRNDRCQWFADVTAEMGIAPSRWSSMPIVADYDRDGFLDVYVVRMGDHATTAPEPNWNARNGVRDGLYRNDGGRGFTDVTAEAGIEERGWGLAGAWGDYDNDGYPDVYVGNEFGFSSLHRNNGDGTFTEVGERTGARDRSAAMGVAWGDYDNDGKLDLFVSNMYANSRWALFHPEFPPPVPWYLLWVPRSDIDSVTDELTRGSTLLRNNGDGTLTDVSDQAGVRDTQWGWGAEFLDYNNDGRLDVYASNGFLTGPFLDDV